VEGFRIGFADQLQQRFAEKVFGALLEDGLLDCETVSAMRAWPHSGFHVFLEEPVPASDTAQRLFTARYLKKCPISNKRLRVQEQDSQTTVHYNTYRNGTREVRSFSPLEFLAELQQHVPNMWEQMGFIKHSLLCY